MFHPSYAPPVPLDLESGAERKSAPAGTVLPSLAGRLPPEFFERQHFTDEQKLLWDELVDIVEQMFTLPKIPPRLTGRLHQIVFRITGIFDLDRLQTNVRERQASLRFMVLCLVETHLKKILAQLEAAPDADLLQELTRSWTQLLSILSSLGFAMAPVHDVISPSRLYRINFIFNDTITTLKLLLPPALLDRISNRILLELIDVRHKNEPFDFNHFSLMVDFLRILDKHSTDIEDRDILPLPAPPSRSPLRARLFEEHFLSTTSAYLKEQHSLICSAEPSVYFSKVLEIFRKEEEKFILLMPETIKDLEWMVINIFFPNMQQMLDFLFDTLCRVGPCNDAVTLIRLLAFQPESEEPTKQRVEAWMHQLCVKTCTPFVDNFAAVRRDPQELLIAMYDVYQGATSGMNSVPIEEIKIAVPKTFGHFINEVAFSPRGLFSQSPDCSFAILVAVALDRYIRTFPTGSPLPPEHLNNGDPLSKQLRMLELVQDKEQFKVEYHRRLAHRLIGCSPVNIDLESRLLDILQTTIGTDFISDMKRLLSDMIERSSKAQETFLEAYQDDSTEVGQLLRRIELKVSVISMHVWPLLKAPTCFNLPHELAVLVEAFEKVNLQDDNRRSLHWQLNVSHGTLAFHPPDVEGGYQLKMATSQMVVLLLFNAHLTYTRAELARASGLPANTLDQILNHFVQGRLLLEEGGDSIAEGGSQQALFRLNLNFRMKRPEASLLLVLKGDGHPTTAVGGSTSDQGLALGGATPGTQSPAAQAPHPIIQAAIVRVVKPLRDPISVADLATRVREQLEPRFVAPSASTFKSLVQQLVEKDFITDTGGMIEYLA